MPLPLVATAVYPMRRDWIEAYLAGIAALAEPVTLLLLREAGTSMPACDLPHHRVISREAPSGITGGALRAAMLQTALAEAPEFVICTDYDDVIGRDAVALHRSALQQADISFGDMALLDANGTDRGAHFLDVAPVPQKIQGSVAITDCNFFGFTNTAMRTDLLKQWDGVLPSGLAAADWWLFTRWLDGGFIASRTASPVVAYRSHAESILGACKAADLAALRRRIEIALAHFSALPQRADRKAAQNGLRNLASALEGRPRQVEQGLAALPQNCVWFQDVFALAETCEARV